MAKRQAGIEVVLQIAGMLGKPTNKKLQVAADAAIKAVLEVARPQCS